MKNVLCLMGAITINVDENEDKIGAFADLLLEPQFRANIDNILTLQQQQKKDSLTRMLLNLGDIVVRTGSVDCLTDETLPIAFHSKWAHALWSCLDGPGRQILYTGYKSNRMLSKTDLSYDADGMPWKNFMLVWSLGTRNTNLINDPEYRNINDPEYRKIINDHFHENYSSRED